MNYNIFVLLFWMITMQWIIIPVSFYCILIQMCFFSIILCLNVLILSVTHLIVNKLNTIYTVTVRLVRYEALYVLFICSLCTLTSHSNKQKTWMPCDDFYSASTGFIYITIFMMKKRFLLILIGNENLNSGLDATSR